MSGLFATKSEPLTRGSWTDLLVETARRGGAGAAAAGLWRIVALVLTSRSNRGVIEDAAAVGVQAIREGQVR